MEKLFVHKGMDRRKLIPLVNRFHHQKSSHQEILTTLQEEHAFAPFHRPIPASAYVEKMSIRRDPLPAYAPRTRPGMAFQALWKKLQSLPANPQNRTPNWPTFLEQPEG
jgi:hypothetical protein